MPKNRDRHTFFQEKSNRFANKLCLSLFLAALLGPQTDLCAGPIRVDAGASLEDYSFADRGWAEWTLGSVPLGSHASLLAGQSAVRRFGFTDAQGTLGGSAVLASGASLEAQTSLAPGAEVLPTLSANLLLYQGLARGTILNPGYRYSHYREADVHMLTLGGEWESRRGLALVLRGYASATRFESGSGTRWTPGILAQASFALTRKLQLKPFYAYREESFQAGAPGQLRSQIFRAHTGGLEARWKATESLFLRVLASYEGRIPSNILRQYELGLSYIMK